jgi:hypothetical protein
MAGISGSPRDRAESDPREFEDGALVGGREADSNGRPPAGDETDGNPLADVTSGESFGGEDLHEEPELDDEEARALSEELGQEFSDVDPEGA